jgi:hypothetical protein
MKSLKSKAVVLSLVIPVILTLVGLTSIVGAQTANIPGVSQVGPSTVGGVVDIIRQVVRWIYIIFFIVAVLFILFAAFTYLTAGGEAEKVNTAKNQLIYAVVAIAVALLAVGFEAIVRNFLSSPSA